MGPCGYNHCSPAVGRRGGPQHRRGRVPRPSLGSFPLHRLDGSNVPANDTPSVIPRFRLACIGELPLHAGKLGGQGVLCTHSHRGVCRAQDKGQSLVFTILSLLCRSVVRVCFATSCGPVYLRRWRSPSSILRLSGRAQQGFGQEPQRRFQRASVLLEAGFAIHCIGSCSLGIWLNRFLPYSSRLACKCRKIEEWSLSTGSPYFLRIHVRLSLSHDVFDLPLFL